MISALEKIEDIPHRIVKEFNQVNYGDVIGVDRGLYSHYGIYVNEEEIIHYASENGLITPIKSANDRLYSGEETVRRAKSKLGENKYNLLTNNCEHFAIWCKTGFSESHQVNNIFKLTEKEYIHIPY